MEKIRGNRRLLLCCIVTFVAVGLLVTGFFVPPTGQIDGSVLKAAGELLGFNAFFLLWHGIDKGWGATLRHGETEITLRNDEDKDGAL